MKKLQQALLSAVLLASSGCTLADERPLIMVNAANQTNVISHKDQLVFEEWQRFIARWTR